MEHQSLPKIDIYVHWFGNSFHLKYLFLQIDFFEEQVLFFCSVVGVMENVHRTQAANEKKNEITCWNCDTTNTVTTYTPDACINVDENSTKPEENMTKLCDKNERCMVSISKYLIANLVFTSNEG